MSRYETHVRDGMTFTRDNGPSCPQDMTDKELRDSLRGIRPNNAMQMDFRDMLTRYGGTLAEARKRNLHIDPEGMFSEEEQWRSYIEKETGQKIGYIDLFEAGLEVLNHPDKARVVVTVADVVEAGRKSIQQAKALALASDKTIQPIREKAGRPGNTSISENGIIIKGGNNATYRVARLKRDHPGIAERLAQGEFPNVREAERAAGMPVKPKMSPLERAKRIVDRLSAGDRQELIAYLATGQ